ncbi:hypothetical protein M0P65_03165 [Candidatus Gracilibacteria bacterium]|nr:hypothetical protein [Candidatus Gracilibacteria bacterium]
MEVNLDYYAKKKNSKALIINNVHKIIVALCSIFSGHLLSNFHVDSLQNVVKDKPLFLGGINTIKARSKLNTICDILRINNI